MSTEKRYAKQDFGFVGWRGQSVRLNGGDEYDLDDPIVQDLPDLFTAKVPEGKEPPKRRPGRPRKTNG